jgi:hypothetical protein
MTIIGEEIRFEPFDPTWRATSLEVFEALWNREPDEPLDREEEQLLPGFRHIRLVAR